MAAEGWAPFAQKDQIRQPHRRLIGYARVSNEEQGTDPQLDQLRDAGCVAIHQEHASGADRSRPMLARLLREIGPGRSPVSLKGMRERMPRGQTRWQTPPPSGSC
jgi:hypothetical protein